MPNYSESRRSSACTASFGAIQFGIIRAAKPLFDVSAEKKGQNKALSVRPSRIIGEPAKQVAA